MQHSECVPSLHAINDDPNVTSELPTLTSPLCFLHSSDAIGQRERPALPQGGRGGGERKRAPGPTTSFPPLQPPVQQHKKQIL